MPGSDFGWFSSEDHGQMVSRMRNADKHIQETEECLEIRSFWTEGHILSRRFLTKLLNDGVMMGVVKTKMCKKRQSLEAETALNVWVWYILLH